MQVAAVAAAGAETGEASGEAVGGTREEVDFEQNTFDIMDAHYAETEAAFSRIAYAKNQDEIEREVDMMATGEDTQTHHVGGAA